MTVDGSGLAEALLGLGDFRVLAVTETPDEVTITGRLDHATPRTRSMRPAKLSGWKGQSTTVGETTYDRRPDPSVSGRAGRGGRRGGLGGG